MSRGNRRDDIFLDDVDRHDFLKTLAELIAVGASDPVERRAIYQP